MAAMNHPRPWREGFKDGYAGRRPTPSDGEADAYESGRLDGHSLRMQHQEAYERALFAGSQVPSTVRESTSDNRTARPARGFIPRSDPTETDSPPKSSRLSPVFDEQEWFIDCSGARRAFALSIYAVPGAGFSGHAYEVTADDRPGYSFRVSEAHLPIALGRLRQIIGAGLAQRYLIRNGDQLDMPLDRLCGHIDGDGLVVDGELLS